MKTATELKEDISALMSSIREQYPELSRNIPDMSANGQVLNITSLNNYFNALLDLLYDYGIKHDIEISNYNSL